MVIVVFILAVYFLNVLKCEVLSISYNYSYWLTGYNFFTLFTQIKLILAPATIQF